ncbi:hypothetical protein Celaphus_00016793 [Cervus elaphus hippelaphus]|uniref:FARP1 n=1 Tax=Cervus elaphus hippelaphus TaxID=46360 RepID=A0A212C4L9_CEREH|nr:hypothetical protein Celaphus_00016793 [Cervus elaphus hippelaphus]
MLKVRGPFTQPFVCFREGRSNAHIRGDYQRIGDVMLKNIQGMKQLAAHLWKHSEALEALETGIRGSRRLEGLCRDFELQKVCYLPLNTFLLRPLHRLMHYKQVLERLCKHYPPSHTDFRDCRAALAEITEMVAQLHGTMIKMENFQKLHELKKDLIGVDNLGGLHAILTLFRSIKAPLGCRFHLLKLSPVGERQPEGMDGGDPKCHQLGLTCPRPESQGISHNQLSGNLLRKFKNSNGWQKLWVVFTNFCLFFYKSHQDNHPLASLPLLGYSLTIPSESEDIHKDYVFKLHFKSHVYYFRAESEYTFERKEKYKNAYK